MTELENKQEVTESSPHPSSPVMTPVESETNSDRVNTSIEADRLPENKEESSADVVGTEEDDFADAVDEMNIKTAQDLSQVISEL